MLPFVRTFTPNSTRDASPMTESRCGRELQWLRIRTASRVSNRMLATSCAMLALALACSGSGTGATAGSSGHAVGVAQSGRGGSGSGSSGDAGTVLRDASSGGASGRAGSSGRASPVAGSGGGMAIAAGACPSKPLFDPSMAWNTSVESAAKDAQSDSIIAALQMRGWGAGRLQIDFSIDVLCAPESTPLRSFTKTDNYFPDECDDAQVPVPGGGHVEGEDGYECIHGGDCHLIVISAKTLKLYEQWVASIDAQDHYSGGCLAVWDLQRAYSPTLRGDQCSSAYAAGLPIAPLLFDADEVAAGEIRHAVRFALPNTHIRNRTYVRPATHATGAASAGTDGVPYGARLRLRADYPLNSLPNDGARTVARALQRYGMILADGGNIALMGQDDRGTSHKWQGLLGPRDLSTIAPRDFELVEAGERLTWKGACTLNQ
jgi:hypothetical protein